MSGTSDRVCHVSGRAGWLRCRALLLLGGWLILSTQLPGHRVGRAQPPEPAAPALEATTENQPLLTVTIPRELRQGLDEAEACLRRQDEAGAIGTLQSLLESPEDFFLDRTRQSSLKQTLRERLLNLTDKGRQQYELLYGSQAQRRLEEAIATQN